MNFKLGDSAFEVQTIRGALGAAGFHPNYTVMDPNLFDSWVEAAVKAFQLANNLKPDGIVGPNTWAALNGTSVQPGTSPLQGAGAADPSTQPDPGQLPTQVATPGAPSGGNTMLFVLGGLGIAFWWWKNRKKGGTLAGLPFGEDDGDKDEARKERERRRRENNQRIDRITQAYEVELRRLQIDPVRAPGHAQALMNRVARADDKADELEARLDREIEDNFAKKYDPRRRAEILREMDADIAQRTDAERAQARADMRIMRPELKGRSKKGSEPMYRQQHTPVGRKMFPGNTSPTVGLRNRERAEDDKWLERVESAKPAAQATQRIVVQSKRYHTDKKYREAEQEDARQKAEAGRREVQLINERGVVLFRFQPNIRNFKDAASERLIDEVANDAKKKNCPKAVRNLFRVRPLALDFRTEEKLDAAAEAVAKNCSEHLQEDLEFREEAREEAGGERPITVTPREIKEGAAALVRSRKKKAPNFTPKAIQREIEKGNISKEDGAALLQMARDHAKTLELERESIFDPPRGTSKMVRRRQGEKDAHVYVSPEGRKRTLRK